MIISYVPADKGSSSTRLTSIPDHSELWLVQMRMRIRYPLINRVKFKDQFTWWLVKWIDLLSEWESDYTYSLTIMITATSAVCCGDSMPSVYSGRQKNCPGRKKRQTFQQHFKQWSKAFHIFFLTHILFLYVCTTGFRNKIL